MPSLSELVQARKDAEAAADAADDQYISDVTADEAAQAAANATSTQRKKSRITSAKAARTLDQAVEAERAALGDIPPEPAPEPPAPQPDLPVT